MSTASFSLFDGTLVSLGKTSDKKADVRPGRHSDHSQDVPVDGASYVERRSEHQKLAWCRALMGL
jgi:hypothetical protein